MSKRVRVIAQASMALAIAESLAKEGSQFAVEPLVDRFLGPKRRPVPKLRTKAMTHSDAAAIRAAQAKRERRRQRNIKAGRKAR